MGILKKLTKVYLTQTHALDYEHTNDVKQFWDYFEYKGKCMLIMGLSGIISYFSTSK